MFFRTIVPNGYGGGTTAREHVNNPAHSLEDAQRVADRTPGAYVERSANGLAWERVAADAPTATPTDAAPEPAEWELALMAPAPEAVAWVNDGPGVDPDSVAGRVAAQRERDKQRAYAQAVAIDDAQDADPFDTSGPWVSVVFVDGDDYEAAVDAANDNGGSTDAVAEYLSQWDYGDETDMAQTRDCAPWGNADILHSVNVGGLDYVLSINHHVGYYGLNRRPLA